MAVLKLYNDEKVVELLNDEVDVNRPYDSATKRARKRGKKK